MEATIIELEKMKNDVFHHEHHSPEGPLATRFHLPYNKTTWFAATDFIDVPSKKSDDGKFIYQLSSKPSLLTSSKLNVDLPEIKTISDRVRVAWPKDLFIHMINEATLMQSTKQVSKLVSQTIDIYHNFFEDDHIRQMEKEARGNIPQLIDFNHHLPKYTLDFAQPWFYNLSTSNSFPLIYNDKEELTTHVYDFKRKLSELLRVQIYDDMLEKWIDVKFDKKYFQNIKIEQKIAKPRLSAIYSFLDKEEKEHYTSNCLETKEHKIIRFKEFIALNDKDLKTIGDKFSLCIKSKTPCFSLFWFAENRQSTHNNNYGNYTLDNQDGENGRCPIVKYTITYDGQDIKSTGDSAHRCISQVRTHFGIKPVKNGYGVYSSAWWPKTEAQADISLDYKDINVTLDLDINDPDIESEYQQELNSVRKSDDNPIFMIKAFALVMRKVEVENVNGKKVFNIDNYDKK